MSAPGWPAAHRNTPMQTRILCALIAMSVVGTAVAQAVQPPPAGAGMSPAPLADTLPPLPPGCTGDNGAMPPPPRPATSLNDNGFNKGLGINSAQVSKVKQVLEYQFAQAERLNQQRRQVDADTCRSLRSIIGDQSMARWSAATPPPPPPPTGGPAPGFAPFGPHGMTPPPLPPPQGK